MHEHSLEAHTIERDSGRLSRRAQAIMALYVRIHDHAKPFIENGITDREAMDFLYFKDMNSVRPRITELIKSGKLEECGSMLDPATNKRVRLVRLKQGQQRLF
jgi:hypothetical protein